MAGCVHDAAFAGGRGGSSRNATETVTSARVSGAAGCSPRFAGVVPATSAAARCDPTAATSAALAAASAAASSPARQTAVQ